MQEYSQILRGSNRLTADIPPPTELHLWNKEDVTPAERAEFDRIY
jgi:hypothetical protein